jgi:hypothetical protein
MKCNRTEIKMTIVGRNPKNQNYLGPYTKNAWRLHNMTFKREKKTNNNQTQV